MFHVPENYRIRRGALGSDRSDGNNGAFLLAGPIAGRSIICVVSDGEGWEHVSVSISQGSKPRTPVWEEMAFVKGQFWGEEDCVMQLHPPRRDYVNFHAHTLHLWRPTDTVIPQPDPVLVGPRTQAEARGHFLSATPQLAALLAMLPIGDLATKGGRP